jgi:hypothetical protein
MFDHDQMISKSRLHNCNDTHIARIEIVHFFSFIQDTHLVRHT